MGSRGHDPEAGDATPAPPAPGTGGKTGLVVGTTAGVAILFLLLRLLAVSEWDWNTAEAVSDTFDFGDLLPVIFGTLFARPALTGAIIAVLLPLGTLQILWPISANKFNLSITKVLASLTLIMVTYAWIRTFRSWWILVVAFAIGGAIVLARLIWSRGLGHRIISWVMRSIGALTVGAVLLLAITVDTPWVSKELIETAEGPIEGWVLEARAGFLKILTEDRDFVIRASSQVTSRTVIDE